MIVRAVLRWVTNPREIALFAIGESWTGEYKRVTEAFKSDTKLFLLIGDKTQFDAFLRSEFAVVVRSKLILILTFVLCLAKGRIS